VGNRQLVSVQPAARESCTAAIHARPVIGAGFFDLRQNAGKEKQMIKIQILDRCPHCEGKAYLPIAEDTNDKGEKYIRHLPCPVCQGTGSAPRWISLADFLTLLKSVQCPHTHTSIHGGMHLAAGEVWDDIALYCDDCGANLDRDEPFDFLSTES